MTDNLGAARCPEHLVVLVDVGDDPEGRDARLACPVPGCTWVRDA